MSVLSNLAAMIVIKKVHNHIEKKLGLKASGYSLVCLFAINHYHIDVSVNGKIRRYPIEDTKQIEAVVKTLSKKELSSNEVLDGVEINYVANPSYAKATIYFTKDNEKQTKTIEL